MAPWCRRARTAENRQVADGSGATLQCASRWIGLGCPCQSRHRSGALHNALGHRRPERGPIFTRHFSPQSTTGQGGAGWADESANNNMNPSSA
jgi:hypothetical protein